MPLRVFTAVIGAIAVTLALLLAMSRATDLLLNGPVSSKEYFGITSYIPAPPGRRLPTPPPAPAAKPAGPQLDRDTGSGATLTVEPPSPQRPQTQTPAPALPDLGGAAK